MVIVFDLQFIQQAAVRGISRVKFDRLIFQARAGTHLFLKGLIRHDGYPRPMPNIIIQFPQDGGSIFVPAQQ